MTELRWWVAGRSSHRLQRFRRTLPLTYSRFPPEYVVNTSPRRENADALEVHPHIRGEHAISATTRNESVGSPPPAWGTRQTRSRGFTC